MVSRMLKKFVQQGRRRVETGGVPRGYVEDFDEPRTKLADFFSILLVRASVFEGELRDGGLVQFAFAESDQSQVLIVSRLS